MQNDKRGKWRKDSLRLMLERKNIKKIIDFS